MFVSPVRWSGATVPSSDCLTVSVFPLQPVPQPVVCEQRHHHSRGSDGGDVQRAGSAVLPGLLGARCASHTPGPGRLLLGIPAVRRGPHGHRHSRQPVRCLGPSPPHSLVDARVTTFHVKQDLCCNRRRTSAWGLQCGFDRSPGYKVAAHGSREGIGLITLPLK